MIRTFVFSSLIFIPFLLSAKFVTIERANNVAKQFYEKQFYKFNHYSKSSEIKETKPFYYNNSITMYIIVFNPKGFVIVSSDDNSFPIIGYSFDDNISLEQLPPSATEYLNLASAEIVNSSNLIKSFNNSIWNKIEQEPISKTNFSSNSVAPLITLKWDQGVPYNNYCPPNSHGPGGHCVTGCVATAMAMAMKYYNYPEHGQGTKEFYWVDLDTVDYEHTYYRWSQMTAVANSQSGDAIAELMYHCGVSVNMNYGPDGSSSFTEWVPDAMRNNFRYHPSIRYKERIHFSDYDWDILIRDELNNSRIIIYSGTGTGGHAFICDGYQDTCFYHFNWGWSGYANGYYYYNDLTPGSDDFTYSQGAVVNIMPYFANYCQENVLLIDTTRSLNDGSGLSYYWNNTHCSWIIKPQNATQIKLNFTSFNTEANNDILNIYDGENAQSSLLGSFSGNMIPSEITSTGGSVYLEFNSNDTIQGLGWDLYYTTTVGINNNHINQNFKIFPTPANNILNVNPIFNGFYNLRIIDILGKTVYKETCHNNSLINVENLMNGFYFVEIEYNHMKFVQKFSIKH